MPLESFRYHSSSVRHVACNWKTYGDNFLEGYHLPTTHPAMSRDADALELQGASTRAIRAGTSTRCRRATSSTFGVFGYFWPTFAFDVFPGGFAVERWLPRGHSHSDLIFEYFFADDAARRRGRSSSSARRSPTRTPAMCEHVQRNLDAGNYDIGVLSPKWEEGIRVFHGWSATPSARSIRTVQGAGSAGPCTHDPALQSDVGGYPMCSRRPTPNMPSVTNTSPPVTTMPPG